MGFAKAVPKLLIGHDGLVLRPPVGVNAAPSPALELVTAFGANALSFRREASRATSAFALEEFGQSSATAVSIITVI